MLTVTICFIVVNVGNGCFLRIRTIGHIHYNIITILINMERLNFVLTLGILLQVFRNITLWCVSSNCRNSDFIKRPIISVCPTTILCLPSNIIDISGSCEGNLIIRLSLCFIWRNDIHCPINSLCFTIFMMNMFQNNGISLSLLIIFIKDQ